MTKIAKAVMVLPQSSVSVERIFSQLKNFKSEKRNRLNAENLQASLLLFQKYGGETTSFEITEDLVRNFEAHLQDPPKKVVKNIPSQNISPQRSSEEEKLNIIPNQVISPEKNQPSIENQNSSQSIHDEAFTQKLAVLMNQALRNILLNNVNVNVNNSNSLNCKFLLDCTFFFIKEIRTMKGME